MAKKRKPMSEAQKQHLRDLAKVRYAKTKTPEKVNLELASELEQSSSLDQVPQPVIKAGQTIADEVTIQELQRQIEELKSGPFAAFMAAMSQSQPGANVQGSKLTGTVEKYITDPARYPSPVERLSQERRLQRFAFPVNYELEYNVGLSEYTTIDNIRMREPKFTLKLIRVIMDEATGEPTNGRYVICQMVMHEDPDAALVIAREQNLEIDSTQEEAIFLNEMRYIRMRDWLLECFYPAPAQKSNSKREMVIDNRVVTYYEVNDVDGKTPAIDFSKLPKIKF